MIIKSLKIDAFGGIKNRIINFGNDINIIYGENEKGKSTMEAFIKIMLYGIQNKRGKGEGERAKYMPFSGESMKGSIVVEWNDREYIIQRSFGITKKDDKSIILDRVSGEEAKNINLDEPGKSLLGINRSTFEKTLYINQLGVTITKDKEEEIMEKVTAIFGCEEEEVPFQKAVEKLEGLKKELTTTRGVGYLDQLKKKYSSLLEERYEAYKIAEQNLEWESQLLDQRDRKKFLSEEINKLELYKKYLKRVNLQKEYKEISEYLRKSEELKREEKQLNKAIGSELIDDEFIDNLKEENKIYLGLLDQSKDIKNELERYEYTLIEKRKIAEEYSFIDLFEDNLKERLIEMKYELKSLEDKNSYINNIRKTVLEDEKKLLEKKEIFDSYNFNETYSKEIEENFIKYEENLKEIKFLVENNNLNKGLNKNFNSEKNKRLIGICGIVVGGILLIFGFPIIVLGIALGIISLIITFKSSLRLKEFEGKIKAKERIDALNNQIKKIEEQLQVYMNKLKLSDYRELMAYIKKYNNFKDYEERVLLRIEEKRKLISEEEYQDIQAKITKNYEMINSLKNLSNCGNIDTILIKINEYEKIVKEIEEIELGINSIKDNLTRIEKELIEKEKSLVSKLEIMNLNLGNLLDIEFYIREYKEKIKKKDEIHNKLTSMEETYKVLLKDRDIDKIKNELEYVINEDNKYVYQTEEEIENIEKERSKSLIECEKLIKDLENNINNRLIGKRNIVEIEEDINKTQEIIKEGEIKVKALDIAIEKLKESFEKIRMSVGPTLNKIVAEKFNIITDNKYSEVLLADNYEMMVNDGLNIFKGNYLSNGTWDQLYLSLRLAFIDILFPNGKYTLMLDDAFVQYDDNRRKKVLLLLSKEINGQMLIFTCQSKEEELCMENKIDANIIRL